MISVLLSTQVHPEQLRRALRGVRAQRDAIWEAVVIDGTPDARLLSVARQFGDQRIRAYRNPGQGAVAGLNAALEVARGAVIALLEGTAVWSDPHHLSRVCAALKHGEALVHQGGYLEDGFERHPYAPQVSAQTLLQTNPLLVSGVAYPAVMHDWLGGFDQELPDEWLWDWALRVTGSGVPLRTLPNLSLVTPASDELDHPAQRARDVEHLMRKHGLRDLRPTHPWAQRLEHASGELIAAD